MFKKKKKVIQAVACKLIAQANPKSVVSEQFRTLRTNINFSSPDAEIETLLFTSASPGEGKSTVASNTAVVYAQSGKKVLLIDADMRKPTVHYTFHMTNTTGLSNLLTRQSTFADVIKMSDIPNLDVITCGPIPPNPAELLGSKTMAVILKSLKDEYDLIVFDAPPILSVADAQIISNKVDGTVLVLNAGETEKEVVGKAHDALKTSKANVIGAVVNNFQMDKNHYYQYYGTPE